jgi:hypothetical protein
LAESTQVRMTQDRNVSASFSIHSYNLSVSAGDGGTVTGNGFFDYGSDALVTASPNLGFSFIGWVGDGVINPLTESTQVRMTENRHISASFSLRYHSLSLQASEGGFVSESGSFLYGSSVSISAIPQVGYSFLSWTGEGVSNRFSTTNEVLMDQDRNISASFTISITAGLELSSLGGNWYSSWFGIFYQSSNHWVYHFNLGWIFLTIDGSNLWIWNDQHGWLWTSPTQYLENFLWSAKLETWIYLELKEPSEPRIWNYDSSSWTPWFP